ncbi:hypothetical protein M8J75_010677 [Diaphorina citri]|nr:hypothetical protein M8J75_010677 [Diaphorina citri]
MATTSSGSKQTPPNRDEGSGDQKKTDGGNDKSQIYDCNICFDTAKDAVISMCGHLFCWPCLHQWLETCPNRQTCPVCKAAIDKDKVIPVYGRGGSEIDPRDEVPPRPQGQRTERENSSRGMFDDAITRRSESNSMWSLGESGFSIGEFLLGLFSSTSTLGDQRLRSGNGSWGSDYGYTSPGGLFSAGGPQGRPGEAHAHGGARFDANVEIEDMFFKLFLIFAALCLFYILFVF